MSSYVSVADWLTTGYSQFDMGLTDLPKVVVDNEPVDEKVENRAAAIIISALVQAMECSPDLVILPVSDIR